MDTTGQLAWAIPRSESDLVELAGTVAPAVRPWVTAKLTEAVHPSWVVEMVTVTAPAAMVMGDGFGLVNVRFRLWLVPG